MELTPETVLFGYSVGIFPMADPDDDNAIAWYSPEERGILPLDGLHISKTMLQLLRSGKYHITINESFEEVMRGCAARDDTWISEEIIEVYTRLFELGDAFSFETRTSQGQLVGGLYGVVLGRAFFGESMFHTHRDASKFALVKLVEWLNIKGFILLDTQFITPHLQSLGAIKIPRQDYMQRLQKALR